jgi:hypothetical protein
MKRNVKKYTEFINEKEQHVVYPTNFSGMVQGAVSSIQSQILAIAREMASEKAARNPYRYSNSSTKIGEVDEVDITRAINLIFHSDWKKYLKNRDVRGWARKCIERASKHDDRANKKNQRAMRAISKQKDGWKTDLGSMGFSRNNRTT